MITTEELIKFLEQHPGKYVMVEGYEYGYSTPKLRLYRVTLNSEPGASYGGLHSEDMDEGDKATVVLLERQSGREETDR